MEKKKLVLLISICVLFLMVSSAGVMFFFPYNPLSSPKADDAGFSQEGILQIVESNNRFAIDLYHELSKEEGNMFFSPYSISSVLALVFEGSDTTTFQEIQETMYFPELSILRPNFARIYNYLNKNKNYELRVGNALWIQQDYPITEDYKTIVEKYYGAKASNVDFISEKDASIKTINSFIRQQTKNKFKEIIKKKDIAPLTKIILTNAVYFDGTWKHKFKLTDTSQKPFYLDNGNEVFVDMMKLEPEYSELFNYYESKELQVLELPYLEEDVSMMILLPRKGRFYSETVEGDGEVINVNYTLKDIEEILTYDLINQISQNCTKTHLDNIFLPKFEFEKETDLKDILMNLGIKEAFSTNADFSKISNISELFLDKVKHFASIKVNEQGTVAVSVTFASISEKGLPTNFNANRPFIFLIKDNSNNNILFLGRINNPNLG